jgi:CheY-like chemotaxis protein
MSDTVLYVEDNDDNIRLIQRIMQRRPNVDLVIATTGGQGIRLAREAAPRLILLDRRLPDMLGNEVLRQLNAVLPTSAIPVVVLSGDSASEHTAEALELGAAEFLAKPFDVSQILSVVDRFCPVTPVDAVDPVGN